MGLKCYSEREIKNVEKHLSGVYQRTIYLCFMRLHILSQTCLCFDRSVIDNFLYHLRLKLW